MHLVASARPCAARDRASHHAYNLVLRTPPLIAWCYLTSRGCHTPRPLLGASRRRRILLRDRGKVLHGMVRRRLHPPLQLALRRGGEKKVGPTRTCVRRYIQAAHTLKAASAPWKRRCDSWPLP